MTLQEETDYCVREWVLRVLVCTLLATPRAQRKQIVHYKAFREQIPGLSKELIDRDWNLVINWFLVK